ncbi:MAG: MgtC/SapB family protein [Candidatus Anstonellaceae archaeon]
MFEIETSYIIKLVLSFIIGYTIGLERERKGKQAGIATHILVIAGAMTFCFLSLQFSLDQARIAAAIVTGIGFLCAGIIFREKGEKITNLTTAATLWYSAGLGMLIGLGYYIIALIAALFEVIVLNVPHIGLEEGKKKLI